MFHAIVLQAAIHARVPSTGVPVQVEVACGLATLLGVTILLVLEQLPRHHGEDAWADD